VAALAFVPNLQEATGFATFYLVFAYFVFFWIAQATSWNILSGYTGYFSFGQGAYLQVVDPDGPRGVSGVGTGITVSVSRMIMPPYEGQIS